MVEGLDNLFSAAKKGGRKSPAKDGKDKKDKKDKKKDREYSKLREMTDEEILKDKEFKFPSHMWRVVSVSQTVGLFLILSTSLIWLLTSQIFFNVPSGLVEGNHQIDSIPDIEFINVAQDYLGLVASYQYGNARTQFTDIRKVFADEFKEKFDKNTMGRELEIIEKNRRSEKFYADSTKTEVIRGSDFVEVSFFGDRQKIDSDSKLPHSYMIYAIRMGLVDFRESPPYGIVITAVDRRMKRSS